MIKLVLLHIVLLKGIASKNLLIYSIIFQHFNYIPLSSDMYFSVSAEKYTDILTIAFKCQVMFFLLL